MVLGLDFALMSVTRLILRSTDVMAGLSEDSEQWVADLKLTLLELRLCGGLSKAEASERLSIACRRVASGTESNQVDSRHLSVGCPVLDEYLGGGLSSRGLTEVCGESGSGKTQLCLQTALAAATSAHVLYVCTEERFPERRLRQMDPTGVLSDRVLVAQLGEWPMLVQCLETSLPALRRTKAVGLLVIDSVAALLRADPERTQGIRRLGAALDALWRSGLAVLCVNQVTGVPGGRTAPSLGPAWAGLVTTRLCTSRAPSGARFLRVAFAPALPRREPCPFVVTAHGVRGLARE